MALSCHPSSAQAAAEDEGGTPENPREMFRSLGVNDSYFGQLIDGHPLDASESETLWRVLYRLRTFPLADVERWAQDAGRLAEAIRESELWRGSIYRLRGRAVEVAPVNPAGEAAERYELGRCFRCRLQLDSPPWTVDVYTERIPAKWEKGAEPNATAGAFGVFLKLADRADRPLLVFAAPRIAWYPDNLLGKLGMDFGLLDSPQARRPFDRRDPEDREAFYQMLAAVGRATAGELMRRAQEELPNAPAAWRTTDRQGREQYSVEPLFNEPEDQRGRLVELFGSARRVTEIRLDPELDADIIARCHLDHYYEVLLFTDDSQDNPVTFCVRDLPKGMPYGNRPHYGETVRIAGFFFKTWSYGVRKMADPALQPGDPKTLQQLSPLLIGQSLVWYPAPSAEENTLAGAVIGGLCILFIVAIWLMAWNNRRHERKWLAEMGTRD